MTSSLCPLVRWSMHDVIVTTLNEWIIIPFRDNPNPARYLSTLIRISRNQMHTRRRCRFFFPPWFIDWEFLNHTFVCHHCKSCEYVSRSSISNRYVASTFYRSETNESRHCRLWIPTVVFSLVWCSFLAHEITSILFAYEYILVHVFFFFGVFFFLSVS